MRRRLAGQGGVVVQPDGERPPGLAHRLFGLFAFQIIQQRVRAYHDLAQTHTMAFAKIDNAVAEKGAKSLGILLGRIEEKERSGRPS